MGCASQAATVRSELMVGTLNALGDALNPFEFLSEEPEMKAGCEKLHAAADALTWQVFAEGVGDLDVSEATAALQAHCADKDLWSYFDEATLKNDNKLLEQRFNLLTFAMAPHGDGHQLAWQHLGGWVEEMRALLCGASATYAKDPNLLVWDLVCNVLATLAASAHGAICARSYLNPDNFPAMARTFFGAAVDAAAGRPLALGVVEWPCNGTPKAKAFRTALDELALDVAFGSHPGVAIVYSRSLGAPETLSAAAPEEVMRGCLEAAEKVGVTLHAKAADGCLQTTAAKTLFARFSAAPSAALAAAAILVVHAKEPKTPAAARVLGEYVLGMRAAAGIGDAPFIAVLDSNLAKEDTSAAFVATFEGSGLTTAPNPSVPTTCKMRSRLHGQCYDAAKCLRRVVAAKDRLVVPLGAMAGAATVTPDLSLPGASSLPSSEWGSDHALTTAVLTLSS